MKWFLENLHWIIPTVGVFTAVAYAVKKYTDKTPQKWDDKIGKGMVWLAGLMKAILKAFKPQK